MGSLALEEVALEADCGVGECFRFGKGDAGFAKYADIDGLQHRRPGQQRCPWHVKDTAHCVPPGCDFDDMLGKISVQETPAIEERFEARP